MRTARTTGKSHWISVGRRAAASGWPVEQALTKNEKINALIRQGYEARMQMVREINAKSVDRR